MNLKAPTKKNVEAKLQDIADIRFGLYVQPEEEGDLLYLQAKQFDGGMLKAVDKNYIKTDNKSEGHLLKDGDILFVGKGYRNFAWCYRSSYGPAVASSTFFVITPDRSVVYPEFLTTFFNLPQSQLYFQQLGKGTNIVSIRKSELGAMEVPIPPIEQQHKIVEIGRLYQREIELHQNLIIKKQQLYSGIIANLI